MQGEVEEAAAKVEEGVEAMQDVIAEIEVPDPPEVITGEAFGTPNTPPLIDSDWSVDRPDAAAEGAQGVRVASGGGAVSAEVTATTATTGDLLTPEQLADKLGMKRAWVYARSREWEESKAGAASPRCGSAATAATAPTQSTDGRRNSRTARPRRRMADAAKRPRAAKNGRGHGPRRNCPP